MNPSELERLEPTSMYTADAVRAYNEETQQQVVVFYPKAVAQLEAMRYKTCPCCGQRTER